MDQSMAWSEIREMRFDMRVPNFNRQRDGITIERSPDQLDEIQRASERALAVCNLGREFNQLRNIRAALLRIEQESFGKCEECDEEIHPKRARRNSMGCSLYSVSGEDRSQS